MMWLAQPISEPTYSGLFLRRTFAQLSKSSDSPIARAAELYMPLGGKYHQGNHRWTFPSGATIEFGHMQHEMDMLDYQGAAYHRVTYDELTQFSESQYLYLFSRIRQHHGFQFSLGVRSATNPGGPGHEWVRKRFIPEKMPELQRLSYREPTPEGLVFWLTEKRAFVPARVADNPTLDVNDYLERVLGHLPLRLREQLAAGNWDAIEGALINIDWFRYYYLGGENLKLADRELTLDSRRMQRFVVIDTAGSAKDKMKTKKGKPPAHSVISVWDHFRPANYLFLRHVWRARVEWLDLKAAANRICKHWGVHRGYCENAHFGPALTSEVPAVNWTLIGPVIPGMRDNDENAKLDRAVASKLFTRFEKGEIYLPNAEQIAGVSEWVSDYERELTSWTGDKDEPCDQVDVTSYAAHVTRRGGGWGGVVKGA